MSFKINTMKKILLIVFLFSSMVSFAQTQKKTFDGVYEFRDTLYLTKVVYNSGAGIVHLGIDTVAGSPTFGKLVRKTASSSGEPTITAPYTTLKYWTGYKTFGSLPDTVIATVKAMTKSKAVTIEVPSSSEAIDMWQTPVAITVSSIKAILRGSSPSVTYNIRFGTDITSATDVFTANITCTSVTTGCSNSSGFNDATIPAGSFIWVITSAQSGTVNSISLTINYTED